MEAPVLHVSVFLERMGAELQRHADNLKTCELGIAERPSHPDDELLVHMQAVDLAIQTAQNLAGLCQALSRKPYDVSGLISLGPVTNITLSSVRDRLLYGVKNSEAPLSNEAEFF